MRAGAHDALSHRIVCLRFEAVRTHGAAASGVVQTMISLMTRRARELGVE